MANFSVEVTDLMWAYLSVRLGSATDIQFSECYMVMVFFHSGK